MTPFLLAWFHEQTHGVSLACERGTRALQRGAGGPYLLLLIGHRYASEVSATTDPANLSAIFKAYDVRGTVPDQLDEELARAVGAAFVAGRPAPMVRAIVVGHDMRPSSPGTRARVRRRAPPMPGPT